LSKEGRRALANDGRRAAAAAASHAERDVEWGATLPVLDVEPGALLGEEPDEGVFATRDGEMQRRLSGVVGGVDVGAVRQTQPRGFDVFGLGRRSSNTLMMDRVPNVPDGFGAGLPGVSENVCRSTALTSS
jgi:hypothetical protein